MKHTRTLKAHSRLELSHLLLTVADEGYRPVSDVRIKELVSIQMNSRNLPMNISGSYYYIVVEKHIDDGAIKPLKSNRQVLHKYSVR